MKSASSTWLTRLLRPRTIAVIGGAVATRVAEQCDRMGFDGAVWPVHPSKETVLGRRVYRSVAELPDAPDAAFVGVNRHATVAVVDSLSKHGAGGAICYASGFREAPDGGELQRALVEAAGDMPVIGPNCYGLINFLDGVPLWPDQHGGRRLDSRERGVAIITQSSNIAISITMQRRGLPIAYVVTAGNQAQLGVADIANQLLDDDRLSAIGLHVEAFESVRGYEALARRARCRAVPVVVMKVGRSVRGGEAALTHTASVAGSDAAAGALLLRLGFARADGLAELLETLKLLHVHGPLGRRGVGVMCCSGGEASLLADAAEALGVALPDPGQGHAARVAETVHPFVTVANPFDYHTFDWGDAAALRRTFAAFADGPFDATALVIDMPRTDRCDDSDWRLALGAFAKAMDATTAKGVVASTLSENLPETLAIELVGRGIAPLGGTREALAALACAAEIGDGWRAAPAAPLLVCDAVDGDVATLDEAESKARLAAFGVPRPRGTIARSEESAVAAAAALGGPVAVKALGIAHKTERQAVRLGLRDPCAIRTAAGELMRLAGGVLVEEFVADTLVELIVGVSRDPRLGLVLTVGSGGTLVELFGDTATLLLPTTEAEVRDALSALRCAPLLAGYRGRVAADVDAAVAAILAVAQFASANRDRLEELDVNPLGVRRRGCGAVALDALVRTREAKA
ncbi:MAG: acetate--CoA ligase family protein [Gammaproteobacteria bacterium]|nr:acetate--CoA ligase family protein [Gammaproteobacteria bacterium]